jgi:ATP-dependent RNA helicase DDX41
MEDDDDKYEEYVPLKKRREMQGHSITKRAPVPNSSNGGNGEGEGEGDAAPEAPVEVVSLLDQVAEMRQLQNAEHENSTAAEQERVKEEKRLADLARKEAELLEKVSERKALVAVAERAKGVTYTEPLKTDWVPPRYLRERSEDWAEEVRRKLHIIVEGEGVPPPCKTFQDMKVLEWRKI